jgi:hypothetical protein
MSKPFQDGVQELFDTFDKLRDAETRGKGDEVRLRLKNGLSQSCALLRYLVSSDSLLNCANTRAEPWKYFRKLAEGGNLAEFFDTEHEILTRAGLSSNHVALIVLNLRLVIESVIEKKSRLDKATALILGLLADSVCDIQVAAGEHTKQRRSLKRAILSCAGGLVVGLNVFASQNPQALWLWSLAKIPDLFQLSQEAGTFLIHWSAEGTLDDWAEGKVP